MRFLLASLFALALAGCATPHNNYDPLESVNRPIYSLNRGIDKVALRPLADTWSKYMPDPIQKGVHNFFENIADIFAIPAAALQGKFEDAGNGLERVFVNTTVGVVGLFDVASDLEIPKSNEDFGQVLGYWGVPTGPYLMLPLLGPKTLRDTVDPAIHFAVGPTSYINPDGVRYAYVGMNAVDTRTQLLPFDKVLDEQYDEYAFIRDTYLQQRWFKVHDGNPPHSLVFNNSAGVDDGARPADESESEPDDELEDEDDPLTAPDDTQAIQP